MYETEPILAQRTKKGGKNHFLSMSRYEDAPLPAMQPKKQMTADEEEEERIKQEIWSEVERTRRERHEREEKERAEREARLKARKPRAPGSAKKFVAVDESEASEKLLEQRRKQEEDRKKFANLRASRAAQVQNEPAEIVVVASPPPARRSTPQRAPEPETPTESEEEASPVPQRQAPRPVAVAEEISQPRSSLSRTSSTPRGSQSETAEALGADTTNWQAAYEQLKKRFDAEQEGKRRMEQVLLQYENTINSLMSASAPSSRV